MIFNLVRVGEGRLLLRRLGLLEADGEGRVVAGVDEHLDGHRNGRSASLTSLPIQTMHGKGCSLQPPY